MILLWSTTIFVTYRISLNVEDIIYGKCWISRVILVLVILKLNEISEYDAVSFIGTKPLLVVWNISLYFREEVPQYLNEDYYHFDRIILRRKHEKLASPCTCAKQQPSCLTNSGVCCKRLLLTWLCVSTLVTCLAGSHFTRATLERDDRENKRCLVSEDSMACADIATTGLLAARRPTNKVAGYARRNRSRVTAAIMSRTHVRLLTLSCVRGCNRLTGLSGDAHRFAGTRRISRILSALAGASVRHCSFFAFAPNARPTRDSTLIRVIGSIHALETVACKPDMSQKEDERVPAGCMWATLVAVSVYKRISARPGT